MPYVRDAAGKWKQSADGTAGQVGPLRLLVVDKQVDPDGSLARSARSDVMTVTFDSKVTTAAELYEKIRAQHLNAGKPFVSAAFANHGPDPKKTTVWTIAKDLEVDLDPSKTAPAVAALQPLCNVLSASIAKTAMNSKKHTTHICLMACDSAGINPDLVPQLEALYEVDFMASNDETGNARVGGDWKMETDGDFDVSGMYFEKAKLTRYRQTMGDTYNQTGLFQAGTFNLKLAIW
jgi:hypothetical protein